MPQVPSPRLRGEGTGRRMGAIATLFSIKQAILPPRPASIHETHISLHVIRNDTQVEARVAWLDQRAQARGKPGYRLPM